MAKHKSGRSKKHIEMVYNPKTRLFERPGKKRGRGRPKGSKNKPKYGPIYLANLAGKRGRGRPRGSKSKNILKPLKGKHHVKLEGEIYIK